MRAFAIDGFGQEGSIREVPVPEPEEGEVLIRVKVAGLNGTDIAVMSGMLKDYMEHRFPLVPGIDVSGVVERVGQGVDGVREGDEVFGFVRKPVMGAGTLAEQVALPIGGIERKPESLTHEQAAVIAHSGLTAMAAVEAIDPKRDDRVVILGATGGVGTYATQFATERGAQVIAVTMGDYADYARSLGAAEVIDYTKEDPVAAIRERYPDGIDGLIDLVGFPAELVAGVAGLVRSGGRIASSLFPVDPEGVLKARGVESVVVTRFTHDDQFPALAERVASGEIRTPDIQTFSLDDAGEALSLQATRHVRGKVAVLVG